MWWSQSPCGRRTCHSRNLDRGAMSVCWPSREMSTEFLHYASTAPPCSVRTHRWGCLEACFTCWCLQCPLPTLQRNLSNCFTYVLTSGVCYISPASCNVCVFQLLMRRHLGLENFSLPYLLWLPWWQYFYDGMEMSSLPVELTVIWNGDFTIDNPTHNKGEQTHI